MGLSVKHQYERFPYPPINPLALPKRSQGAKLSYEFGMARLTQEPVSHRGIRILVAGAGTLEALVVAQTHPHAREVVAIDLSQNSLNRLRLRTRLAQVTRFLWKKAPIRLVCADLNDLRALEPASDYPEPPFNAQSFDYILASNVLHHSPNPQKLLTLLAERLKPSGILRLVTYPKASRLWMRKTGLWLKINGLNSDTPHLVNQAKHSIKSLPIEHPIRLCFESQPEVHTSTGIVDAFLNVCENPLSPLEWKNAAENASLECFSESHAESSQSGFLDSVIPELKNQSFWNKLQIMDDFLEICSNPILWFKKTPRKNQTEAEFNPNLNPELKHEVNTKEGTFPSETFWEMKQNLLRIQNLLEASDAQLKEWHQKFHTEVGPRVDPKNPDRNLLGLALSDYSLEDILKSERPWTDETWSDIKNPSEQELTLSCPELPDELTIPGDTLRKQADWLQVRLGTVLNTIPFRLNSKSPARTP